MENVRENRDGLLDREVTGRCGNCVWKIDSDMTLTISPVPGTDGIMRRVRYDDSSESGMWAWSPYRQWIRKVVIGEGVKATSELRSVFENMQLCRLFDIGGLDTEDVENMTYMFSGCKNLTDLNGLENWNVKNVTSMDNMFLGCSSLGDISALRTWNTENLRKAGSMFEDCCALSDLSPLAGWNTSRIDSMRAMFRCTSVNDLSPLAEWDVRNVKYMSFMFDHCSSLTTLQQIGRWEPENVTTMDEMFRGCESLTDADAARNWNVSRLEECDCIFRGTKVKEHPFRYTVPMACPRTGEFIAWKVCKRTEGGYREKHVLVKLLVPEDAKRSSAFGKKCRCSKAKVLGFYEPDGREIRYALTARSIYEGSFVYRKWATVSASDFDPDRFNECASGIHFFYEMEDAVDYCKRL